jgi:hypothetical protein
MDRDRGPYDVIRVRVRAAGAIVFPDFPPCPGFRRIRGVLGYSRCKLAGQRPETSAKTKNFLVTRFSQLHRSYAGFRLTG